jgi:SAM-dependent methyltransferase
MAVAAGVRSKLTDMLSCMDSAKDFYDRQYAQVRSRAYGMECPAKDEVASFVADNSLSGAKCLEVGCGRGLLQDLVTDYTGVDLSDYVRVYLHKPFFQASAESLPFADGSFDAIWSITVLEHVANPELALNEMRRVLKHRGLLFLKPAWNCRWHRCHGIHLRPYHELSWHHRWVKLTLPIRESLVWRAAIALPGRVARIATAALRTGRQPLRYKPLPANYEKFWCVDSDACSCIDPADAILWFVSRGDKVVSHPTPKRVLLSRSEAVVVRRGDN